MKRNIISLYIQAPVSELGLVDVLSTSWIRELNNEWSIKLYTQFINYDSWECERIFLLVYEKKMAVHLKLQTVIVGF